MNESLVRELFSASATFARLVLESRLPRVPQLCTLVRSVLGALSGPQSEPGGPHHSLQPPAGGSKKKVIVLGGGAAGVATAFWLTHPILAGRYDVTIYQMGWRLGGKCASGRDTTEEGRGRIKEHGLHMLMGCYHHVFHALRACYGEWKPYSDSAFKSLDDAFTRQSSVTLKENDTDPSRWDDWTFTFPNRPHELPGDAKSGEIWPVTPELCDLGNLFANMVESQFDIDLFRDSATKPFNLNTVRETFTSVKAAFKGRDDANSSEGLKRIEDLQRLTGEHFRVLTDARVAGNVDAAVRRTSVLISLGLAMMRGVLLDVCIGTKGVDGLNGKEFRAWLKEHGASDDALGSALMRVLYDLMFAYRDGDGSGSGSARLAKGDVAAGVALQFVFETVVGYKGAILWKMNAGMGDTVFTPFYQVLKDRGVRINFFHRVRDVLLTADKSRVGEIVIDRQADVQGEYDPLVRVGNLDCWPDRPRWDALVGGGALEADEVNLESDADTTTAGTVNLEIGPDDIVVFALPPAVLAEVTKDLQMEYRFWSDMLAASRSVVTVSLQYWARFSVQNMGGTPDTVISAFEPVYSSGADMTHLLTREQWDTGEIPQALGYFCGCVVAGRNPTGVGRSQSDNWIQDQLPHLWPALKPSPSTVRRPDPAITTYARANRDASELYVQTPAGSVSGRPSPSTPYFGNVYIAGDWTKTRFSGGCVESAFESGLRVAGAIAANQHETAQVLFR